jgi:hypothetical protein
VLILALDPFAPLPCPIHSRRKIIPRASQIAATLRRTIPCDEFEPPAIIHFIHALNNGRRDGHSRFSRNPPFPTKLPRSNANALVPIV